MTETLNHWLQHSGLPRSEARMLDGIDEQVFKAMLDRLEANATAQLEALG